MFPRLLEAGAQISSFASKSLTRSKFIATADVHIIRRLPQARCPQEVGADVRASRLQADPQDGRDLRADGDALWRVAVDLQVSRVDRERRAAGVHCPVRRCDRVSPKSGVVAVDPGSDGVAGFGGPAAQGELVEAGALDHDLPVAEARLTRPDLSLMPDDV